VGTAALVAFAACGDDGDGEPGATPTAAPGETPAATQPPSAGGVYNTGMTDDITTNNFWSYTGPDATVYTGYVLDCLAMTLFRYSESRWDWVPHLATELPSDVVKEGDLWTSTLTLDSDATWSDGEPMTADDAVFTWHTIRDLEIVDGNWPTSINLDFFDHAEAVDANTLKVFFSQEPGLPVWQFGLALAPILPEHYWGPVVEEAKASDDPVATLYAHDASDQPGSHCNQAQREAGAFVENKAYLDNHHQGTTVIEYANGAYQEVNEARPNRNFTVYGEATGDVFLELEIGPFVDSTLYNVYADQDSALLAMKQGDFDFWLNPLSLPKGLADQLAAEEGIEIISNPSNGYRYIGFNYRVPPLDDIAVREAVGILVDREFVSDVILQGQAVPVYGTVPEGNAFWFNPDVPKLGQGLSREERVNQALAVMKEAGYTWDVEPVWDEDGAAVNPKGSGLKLPDGTPFPEVRLSAPSAGYDPLRSTFAIWIGTWLNEFGIPVDVQLFGFNLLAGKIFDDQDIDIWILGWGLTPFADHLAAFFDCDQAELGGFNAGGYCTDEFQALIDQFNLETDLDAARDLVFQQQILLAQDLPYVPLFTTPVVEAYRSSAIEFPYTEEVDGLQNTTRLGLPYAVKIL
jgi:ABC-type transport system substrate-binding protein